MGLKANADGSGAIQVGGSDAITVSAALNTTFAGTVTSTGTVAGATGTLYPLVSGTAQASTSGTSITFTDIPSWVKRITVMFNGVSTSGTSNLQIQLGSGSIETTGYSSSSVQFTGGTNVILAATAGFLVTASNSAVSVQNGVSVFSLLSGNIFIQNGNLYNTALALNTSAGSKTLSGVLDRVRITTVNGTDTFDAGSINILYE